MFENFKQNSIEQLNLLMNLLAQLDVLTPFGEPVLTGGQNFVEVKGQGDCIKSIISAIFSVGLYPVDQHKPASSFFARTNIQRDYRQLGFYRCLHGPTAAQSHLVDSLFH